MSQPQQPQQVNLTIDNLFDLMNIYINKNLNSKCLEPEFENILKDATAYMYGTHIENMTVEDCLNIIIKSYNIAQTSGKYTLNDAFNVVQLIMFIQQNFDKVKEKIHSLGKGKEKEETVEKVEKVEKEDDLSDLIEPVPLKGKIINI
jgi:hypothetical protein